NEAFKILCAYIRLLTKWEKTLPYNDRRYIWAIHHLNDAINNFDSLMEMSDDDEQKIRCIDFLIKQGFFAQANEIIEMATKQAQDILDNATIEANNVRASAMEYTSNILADLEKIIKHSIDTATRDYNTALANLKEIDSVVTANRAELSPSEIVEEDITDETSTENSELAEEN
ncbi:MAG: hypothetical protein II193_07260, partial [Lachnospiraceae bacterium]|nr:hypothetical protein [Lachnospiraceae bacterium]